MTFNTSYEVMGLGLSGSNMRFSGTSTCPFPHVADPRRTARRLLKLLSLAPLPAGPVPTWTNVPRASIEIYPGNEGVCGEIPPAPALLDRAGGAAMTPILELPPCPGQDGGGGLSAGAIAGIAIGAAVGVAGEPVCLPCLCWCGTRMCF